MLTEVRRPAPTTSTAVGVAGVTLTLTDTMWGRVSRTVIRNAAGPRAAMVSGRSASSTAMLTGPCSRAALPADGSNVATQAGLAEPHALGR